jgi:transcriptional regulator with XRE-family HTH domain
MSLKSAQTAKIGKQFKSMRESLGLSEKQVSAKTYINVDYIKAIESGDYSIFPARMFALRYFERYSIFLGLNHVFFDIYDSDDILESSEDIKKRQIKDFYPQIKIAAPLLLLAIFFLFIGEDDRPELSNEIIKLPREAMEQNSTVASESDQKLINDALSLIHPFVELTASNADESKLSEFTVSQGVINNLSLRFFEDSWVEIYQGRNQLIYKLFKANNNLEISITPPFKIIVGNAGGIVGFYNQNEINFTQVANKLNVSSIEIDNE